MSVPSVTFPRALYPACAPLPMPMANHLLLQEQRRYARRPTKRPSDDVIMHAVLEKISQARSIVYEFLNPFVRAEQNRMSRGESRTFPEMDFLLETLAHYTPGGIRNAEATVDFWQKRGLLRREKTRGALDITSVAALFIARLAEKDLQRNWLPSSLSDAEPRWWCAGVYAPHTPVHSFPQPLLSAPSRSLVLWTPWQGAAWEEQWYPLGDTHPSLCRWAQAPSARDVLVWDEALGRQLLLLQADAFLGRSGIQAAILEEASRDILDRVVRKGIIAYERSVSSLFYQPGTDGGDGAPE